MDGAPTCGVPRPATCLPPRRVVFGPTPSFVLSSTTVGAQDDFNISAPTGIYRTAAKVAQSEAIGEPGDVVLIQGHTLTNFADVQAAVEIRAIDIMDFPPQRPPHAPAVKLRVQRCSFPGWIYLDANSHIYMPGGEAFDIEVITPQGWTQAPGFPQSEVPFPGQFVDVRVTACVAKCCPTRRTQLTMYGTLGETDMILVPPHAIEVAIYAGSAGVPGNTTWEWVTDAGPFGQFTVNGGFINAYIRPGDIEALRSTTAAAVDAVIVWTVE